MKYPYSNPNLRIVDLINAFRLPKPEAETYIKHYFQKLTGKKHILITNSCRTALYLSYKAIEKKGEVITSPLTCKVAIDPIKESENTPVFADIETNSLNFDPNDISRRISPKTIAIQAIHLGGLVCDMDQINKLAKENNLLVIEDCAQALGAIFNDKPSGSFGDVACFTLIKNAYGIGGGVLATNNKTIFEKARSINEKLKYGSKRLIAFRILRNLAETRQRFWVGSILRKLLLGLKGGRRSYTSITNQLRRISPLETKIASVQLSKFSKLQKRRQYVGKAYLHELKTYDILRNNAYYRNNSSFSKLFLYNPSTEVDSLLKHLHSNGVEAMHLEQKHVPERQKPIIEFNDAEQNGLTNYLSVHDHIISLPVNESFKKKEVVDIISIVKDFLNNKTNAENSSLH